ncbi:MAG: patatin-like phospholipase family protein [Alphaproteobacteria bacterium]|nr:patatin-like phospholipase family protein [Alphaproteobacteria bacterium]
MSKKTYKINFALQGGGSHGAYTWGVLERFLEEEDIEIEAISGTSAGAMNAAVLVNGYAKGGRAGAIALLEKFWRKVSDVAAFSPMSKSPMERMITGWNMDASPVYHWFDVMSRIFSPYELNPLNVNPLKMVLDDVLDMELFRTNPSIGCFVTATHVESGQARVFSCEEMSTEVLLASSCIPFMFQAVQVQNEYYWDGGYMGNPTIWPLIYHSRSEDVVLVQINPIHNAQIPRSAPEIINRLNEITFNSSLVAEMRAIDFVSRLIREKRVEKGRYKDMKMHLVYSPEEMIHLNASSKMNADWDFFLYLRNIGRTAADEWLKENKTKLGVKSTLDIRSKFLCGPGVCKVSFPAAEGKRAPRKSRRKK